MIKVGRISDNNIPCCENYTQIIIRNRSLYEELAPWSLKNHKSQYIENIWEFSKVYDYIPKIIKYINNDKSQNIIWEDDGGYHINNNTLTAKFYKWRIKGINNKYPISNPIGENYGNHVYTVYKNAYGAFVPPLQIIDAIKKLYYF
jgi:hypothetical protein